MFGKKANKISGSIDTWIGEDAVLTGDIVFSGVLRVDGTIQGNVQEQGGTESTIILSENGRIEGAVNTTKIVLDGTVVGPVTARQFIELQTKARITGDLHYKSLEMHMGAVIDGKLVHTEENATDDIV